MSATRIAAVDTERFRFVAGVNGRRTAELHVFIRPQLAVPVVSTEVNLLQEQGRLAVLDTLVALSSTYREEAAEALMTLAPRITAMRAEALTKSTNKAVPTGDPADEPWTDTVSTEAVLDELSLHIRHYVVLDPHEVAALSLWVLHTFVTDVTDYTPYIRVGSPVRECGKSTLLELLRHLAYRAQLTGGITAAALYRRIGKTVAAGESITMLLDELDARLRGDGGEALRGVLNTGFHRTGTMTICVGDDHDERDFATFCPKVLAGIGRLWDTVTSRSIPIRMERAPREELAGLRKIRGDRIGHECQQLRRKLLRWASDVRADLRDSEPDVPAALGARQADVWRPLLAIAEMAGDVWADRAQKAARALHGVGEEEGDYGLLMLEDVRDLLSGDSIIFTSHLIESLVKREDRPWPEYRHDKPITPRGIASLLGRFNVKPTTVRLGDAVGKGYRAEDLAPAFRKYLSKKEGQTPPEPSVTSVTHEAVTDVTDKKEDVGVAVFSPPPLTPEEFAAEERAAAELIARIAVERAERQAGA